MLPPAVPSNVVADMVMFPAMVRFSVSMLIIPALPLPILSTVILPGPEMLIFSGANMLMLPPSSLAVVRIETNPESVKLILRSGSILPISPSPSLL